MLDGLKGAGDAVKNFGSDLLDDAKGFFGGWFVSGASEDASPALATGLVDNSSQTTSTGPITVQTQATDANGIANDFSGAVERRMAESPAMSQTLAIGGKWTFLDEGGATAITFTSFINIDYSNEEKALSYPVEKGGFADYNKVESPLGIRVTLATQGSNSDFEYILDKLNEYKREAVKLSVVTPSALYGNMTLEAYSYRRNQDAGAGMLVVELSLVEVREVETQVTTTVITKPKNPTSSSKANTGKTQTQSVLNGVIFGKSDS